MTTSYDMIDANIIGCAVVELLDIIADNSLDYQKALITDFEQRSLEARDIIDGIARGIVDDEQIVALAQFMTDIMQVTSLGFLFENQTEQETANTLFAAGTAQEVLDCAMT